MIRAEDAARPRRRRGTGRRKKGNPAALLTTPNGGFVLPPPVPRQPHGPATTSADEGGEARNSPVDDEMVGIVDGDMQTSCVVEIDTKKKNRDKKERQWNRWKTVTIPLLVDPYLKMMQETTSLRERPSV